MIFLYLGFVLLILCYFMLKKNYNYWKSKGVPYDKPFFIFGSMFNVVRRKEHMTETVRAIYNKFKTPYVGIYIFSQPYLIIRSPDILKKVLIKDFDKFMNRNFAANEEVDPIAFHSLGSAKDKTWRNLRSKISPVFTSGKMKLMFPLMVECGENLNDFFTRHNGETMEMKDVFKRYSVDIISSCAFGINANCLKYDDSEIMKMTIQLFNSKSFIRNFSIFSFMFLPKFVDLFKLTFVDKQASDYFIDVFKSTLREREEKKIVRNDLIDLLNNLKKNEGFSDNYKFDDIKMAAQAIVFFTAGNDTTATSLSFTAYELARNQAVQNRLRQEISDQFNQTGKFTYETVLEMKYLDMVLKETLRMYPIGGFLNRIAKDDYTFEETGVTLDKGVNILVPMSGLHFDPEYFPNPDKFDPERFSEENKCNRPPYTYLPFGEGPRNCIGERFATLVTKVALAHVVKDFKCETVNSTAIPMELDPSALFLQGKTGVMLKVTKI